MTTTRQYFCLFALWAGLVLAPGGGQARAEQPPGGPELHNCSLWEGSLSPEQHEKAELILAEARPQLNQMRAEMQTKMQELKSLSYNNQTDPQDLARLGRDLQQQRDQLLQELRSLDKRLQQEVGDNVRMRGYHGRGCAALTATSPCPLPQAELQKNIPISSSIPMGRNIPIGGNIPLGSKLP